MFDKRDDPEYLHTCVETITRQWFGHRCPWYGISEEKLAATRLPKPLRRLYSFAGEWPTGNNWESIYAYQDMLLPFETLFSREGKVVFVSENQGVWQAGTLPYGDDPPVWFRVNKQDEPWRKLCDSLTEFLITFCLHEIVFGARHVTCADKILDRFDQIECHISPLWIDGPYVSMVDDIAPTSISFHLVDGQYLVMNNSWCGTSIAEPWLQNPDFFTDADDRGHTFDANYPLPDHPAIPDFIQKNQLNNLIHRHEEQAAYHHEMIEKYTQMIDCLDKK